MLCYVCIMRDDIAVVYYKSNWICPSCTACFLKYKEQHFTDRRNVWNHPAAIITNNLILNTNKPILAFTDKLWSIIYEQLDENRYDQSSGCYKTVVYNTTFHTTLQGLSLNRDQKFNSRKIPYGVSIVSILAVLGITNVLLKGPEHYDGIHKVWRIVLFFHKIFQISASFECEEILKNEIYPRLILSLRPVSHCGRHYRRHYKATPHLIGWTQT